MRLPTFYEQNLIPNWGISVIFAASTRLNLFLPYNKIRDKILKTKYKNTLCL